MPEVKQQHAPGMFCWIELNTSDPAGAKKFYTDLFGWDALDTPAGPDQVYTLLRKDEKELGALCGLQPEQASHGVPPHWMSYISVKSADESAKKAEDLGGKVLMPAFDVMDLGRMAVIQDPQGATFSLWQAKNHIGITILNEENTFCWDELATSSRQGAVEFYTGLFGWQAKTGGETGPMIYTEWINEGQPIGGMYEPTPEMGPMPPNWMPYFAVADCDAIANKAASLGGKLFVPPTDIPNVGRFSTIQDPQGAVFAVITLLPRP